MKRKLSGMRTKNTLRKGFTLIELLVVIAVIGLLATIVIPGVNKAMVKARQTTAMSNVKSIVSAVKSARLDGKKISGKNIQQWVYNLSKYGDINTAKLFYVEEPADLAPSIKNSKGITPMGPADTEQAAPDYDVLSGLRTTRGSDSTPLVWTTGNSAGKSAEWADGPWEEGGHVGFLGGNVEFMESTTGKLANSRGDVVDTIKKATKGLGRIREGAGSSVEEEEPEEPEEAAEEAAEETTEAVEEAANP